MSGECYIIETAYGKDVFVFDETSKIFLSLEEYENMGYPWKLVAFKTAGKYYSEEIILLPEKEEYVLKEDIEKGNISTPFSSMCRIFLPIGNNNKYYPFMIEPFM